MIKKSTMYSVTKGVWFLLAVAIAIGTYVGVADPYLPWLTTLPGPSWAIPGAAVAIGVLGLWMLSALENRAWVSAGRRADLMGDGFAIVGKPTLTGDVRGRSVRAYVHEKGGNKSSNKPYTVVEADLERPAETGLIIVRTDGSGTSPDDLGARGSAPVQSQSVGGYGGAAESEALITDVLTDRVRQELDDVNELEMMYVGGAVAVLPDMESSMVGSLFSAAFTHAFPGDSSTVTTETRGVLLSGDELRARVEAVAAVADAFEDATTDNEWGGS